MLDTVQGVLFAIYSKEIAVALRRIFDPMLIKTKCVWEVADFLKNCKQTAEKLNKFLKNWKKSAASQTHFGFANILILTQFSMK